MSVDAEITMRSQSSGIPEPVLRAVYLREVRTSKRGGESLRNDALRRVDTFLCYALVRDTTCSQDRDLAPSTVGVA